MIHKMYHSLLFLSFYVCKICIGITVVMINFMCRLGWATATHILVKSYQYSECFCKAILEEVSIKINAL